MPSSTLGQPESPPPWCILWHRAGVTPPASLCNALARRGIHLTMVDAAPIAVARVMRAAREIDPAGVLILLLVEPLGLDRAADAVTVASEHVPMLRCWVYEDAASTPLREVTPDDLDRWRRAAGPLGDPPADDAPPPLKLVMHFDESGDDLPGIDDEPSPGPAGSIAEPKPEQNPGIEPQPKISSTGHPSPATTDPAGPDDPTGPPNDALSSEEWTTLTEEPAQAPDTPDPKPSGPRHPDR